MKKLVLFIVSLVSLASCSQMADPVLGIYECERTTATLNGVETEYFEMEVIKHWSNNQTEYQGVYEDEPFGTQTLNGNDATPDYVTVYINLEASDFEDGYFRKVTSSNNTTVIITGYKK